MGAGRRTQTVNVDTGFGGTGRGRGESKAPPAAAPPPSRGLPRMELGGVIFGCTSHTMKECFSGALFGLPRAHISYVQNIEEGMPLFLFNYTTKLLYGIFEASGYGDENINPFAWSSTGGGKQFPAQVPVRIRKHFNPVPESVFRRVIAQNYYTKWHFQFELDHKQTRDLCRVFEAGGEVDPPFSFGISPDAETRPSRAGKREVANSEDHGWMSNAATISQDEYRNPAGYSQGSTWTNHGVDEWTKPGDGSRDDGWTHPTKSPKEWESGASGRSSQDGEWKTHGNSPQEAGWRRPGKSSQALGKTKPARSFQDAEWTSSEKFSQDGGWNKVGKSSQDVGWTNHAPTFGVDEFSSSNGWEKPNPNPESCHGGWTDSGTSFQNHDWEDPNTLSQRGGWKSLNSSKITNPVKSSGGSERSNSKKTPNSRKHSDDSRWKMSGNSFRGDEWMDDKGFTRDDQRAHPMASLQDDEGKTSEASSQDNEWIKPRKSGSSCGRSSSDPISPSQEGLVKVANDGEFSWQENDKWSWKPDSAGTSETPSGVRRGQTSWQDPRTEIVWQALSDASPTLRVTEEDRGGSAWGRSHECVWEPEVAAQRSETKFDGCVKEQICRRDVEGKDWQLPLDTPSNFGEFPEKFIEKEPPLSNEICSLMSSSLAIESSNSRVPEKADDMLSAGAVKEKEHARWSVMHCEDIEPSGSYASDPLVIESNELSKEEQKGADDAEKGFPTSDESNESAKENENVPDDAEKGIPALEELNESPKEDRKVVDDAEKGIPMLEELNESSKEGKKVVDDAGGGISTLDELNELSRENKNLADDSEKGIPTFDELSELSKEGKKVVGDAEGDISTLDESNESPRENKELADAEKSIPTFDESNELSKEDKKVADDAEKGSSTLEETRSSTADKGAMDEVEEGITAMGEDKMQNDKGVVDVIEEGIEAMAEEEKRVDWHSEDDVEHEQLESKQLAFKEEMGSPVLDSPPIDPIAASGIQKNMELCAEVISASRHVHKVMNDLKQDASSLLKEVLELKELQVQKFALQKAQLGIIADVENLKLEFRNLQLQLKEML